MIDVFVIFILRLFGRSTVRELPWRIFEKAMQLRAHESHEIFINDACLRIPKPLKNYVFFPSPKNMVVIFALKKEGNFVGNPIRCKRHVSESSCCLMRMFRGGGLEPSRGGLEPNFSKYAKVKMGSSSQMLWWRFQKICSKLKLNHLVITPVFPNTMWLQTMIFSSNKISCLNEAVSPVFQLIINDRYWHHNTCRTDLPESNHQVSSSALSSPRFEEAKMNQERLTRHFGRPGISPCSIGDTFSSWVNFSIAMLVYQRVSYCWILWYFSIPKWLVFLWKKSSSKEICWLPKWNGPFWNPDTHPNVWNQHRSDEIFELTWFLRSMNQAKQNRSMSSPLEIPMKMWVFS